jgi:hypothetical protein
MALVAADTTLTVSALTDFERNVIAMENALNQHMDQFVNGIQERTQAATVMLSEERARFSRENLERSIREMEGTHRLALKRVQGFRSSEKEHGKREYSRQMVLESVKKYLSAGKKA